MPESCSAWGCTNRRTRKYTTRGITFHRFPKKKERRKQWEIAARRPGCSISETAVLCSEHFRPEDFDRTGQIVRIREGSIPSVFSFRNHRQRPRAKRTTQTSKKAEEKLTVDCSMSNIQETEALPNVDHSYALPESPTILKSRLHEALGRLESLERKMRNLKDRERRAKVRVHCLLMEMKEKNPPKEKRRPEKVKTPANKTAQISTASVSSKG